MKTDEQVLKEWALDRIEFQIDCRRYFTKEDFTLLAMSLFFTTNTVLKLLHNQLGFYGVKGRGILNLIIGLDEDDMLVAVRKKSKLPKFLSLRQPTQLVRFKSLEELYNHVTGRDKQYEEL